MAVMAIIVIAMFGAGAMLTYSAFSAGSTKASSFTATDTYEVHYYDSLSLLETVDAEYSTATLKADATKDGYTFTGWRDNDTDTTYPASTTYAQLYDSFSGHDITLYAQWQANTYTVTFPSSGTGYTLTATKNGEAFASGGTASASDSIVFTATATGAGQKCVLSVSGTATLSGSTLTNVKSNVTISVTTTAETYIVRYFANGGSGTMATQTVTYGEDYYVSACTFTAPSGKVFNRWNTKADDSGTIWEQEYITKSWTWTYDLEDGAYYDLYAIWSWTVSYNANGGTGTMSSVEVYKGYNFILAENKFTRTGYTFSYWSMKADGSETSWQGYIGRAWQWNSESPYNADVTFYAIWTAKSNTITLNANGGDWANKEIDTSRSTSIAATVSGFDTVEGHEDWYLPPTFSSTAECTITIETQNPTTVNIHYYYVYVSTSNSAYISSPSTQKNVYSYDYQLSSTSSSFPDYKTGYNTVTLNITSAGTYYIGVKSDKQRSISGYLSPRFKVEATSYCCKVGDWAISEDGTTATRTVYSGNTYDLPTMNDKNDGAFSGWYTSATGGAKVSSTTLVPDGGTTLYAQWDVPKYTVTISAGANVSSVYGSTTSGASSGSTSLTVDSGTIIYLYATVDSANGYSFDRWTTTVGTVINATTQRGAYLTVTGNATVTATATENSSSTYKLTIQYIGVGLLEEGSHSVWTGSIRGDDTYWIDEGAYVNPNNYVIDISGWENDCTDPSSGFYMTGATTIVIWYNEVDTSKATVVFNWYMNDGSDLGTYKTTVYMDVFDPEEHSVTWTFTVPSGSTVDIASYCNASVSGTALNISADTSKIVGGETLECNVWLNPAGA